MHEPRTVIAASTLAVAVLGALALGADPQEEPEETEGPTLASLAWLAGQWRHEGPRSTVEEVWLRPAGELILGLHRMAPRGEGRAAFEYLRIEARDEGVYYVASPGGGPATSFRLVESGERHAVFANPDHDFPKRVEYELTDEGKLKASATGEDGGGPSWLWTRVAELR